jgi:hypothetical protein
MTMHTVSVLDQPLIRSGHIHFPYQSVKPTRGRFASPSTTGDRPACLVISDIALRFREDPGIGDGCAQSSSISRNAAVVASGRSRDRIFSIILRERELGRRWLQQVCRRKAEQVLSCKLIIQYLEPIRDKTALGLVHLLILKTCFGTRRRKKLSYGFVSTGLYR